jgi:hypothetical protein
MPLEISRAQAKRVCQKLMNAPVAPGTYSHFINAGTESLLDVLEQKYFQSELAEGISCFKYLEGDYGTGKTQFIQCLAQRASDNQVVSAVVDVGQECPFNSPLAIYRAIMTSFLPPKSGDTPNPDKGIEILIQNWTQQKLREMGWEVGAEVPELMRREIERLLGGLWTGAPDGQMASALAALGMRLLALECSSSPTVTDQELISWVRGDAIRSKALKDQYGLYEPARDETAFRRLKTVIGFLRRRMGFQGFFVAFDEGLRTASFRHRSTRQRQAIENMLSMINQNAEGEFEGVMFLYAATPDFRSDIIAKTYHALDTRIGSVAWLPGCPITPLIVLDNLNTPEMMVRIGTRLQEIFAKAEGITWDGSIQNQNLNHLVDAEVQKSKPLRVPTRDLVYHYCQFLDQQRMNERLVSRADAASFIDGHRVPEREEVL